jgi:copper transport protein
VKRALAPLLVLALLALPQAASAHATLEGSSPARGAVVDRAPERVTFRFSEGVEAAFGAVRVYDAKGRTVQRGPVLRPDGSRSVGVGLPGGLREGTYTATYRVISADGHPVSGAVAFSVGAPGAAPDVAELLDRAGAGPVTDGAFGLARGLSYLAIALGVGALGFLALCWVPALRAVAGAGEDWRAASEGFAGRLQRVLWIAVGLGVLGSAAGLVLQASVGSGETFFGALDPSIVREILGTRVGAAWGVRLLAWLALGGILAVFGTSPPRAALAALALAAAVLVVGPAFSGHASASSPAGLLVPVDAAHVAGMSLWLGGLAVLLLVVPAATRRLEPEDRSRLLAAVLLRFSPLALASVLVLIASGAVQSAIHFGWSLSPLVEDAFGRAVAIKVVLLLALVAAAAVNRRRVLPALRALAGTGAAPGEAGRLLRRTLRAEVVLLVAVLGVTAALVSYPPPTAGATGPVTIEEAIGPDRLELTVDPARAGVNEIHVYLVDARTGAPVTGTEELRIEASLPDRDVGPLALETRPAGPGHFLADAAQLAPAGDWELTVANRVSEFDEHQARLEVEIR